MTDATAPPRPADARHHSPWSTRDKLARALWALCYLTLFRPSPTPLYAFRNWLLRRFGARIAPGVRIRPSVHITIPWHLTVGASTGIGDHARLYCLGPVTIGAYVTISQHAHLCAGTHDHTRPDMPLLRPPIVVHDHAWIAADAFVGPGVTLHPGALLGARGCAFKDIPPWTIAGGNPARILRQRPPHIAPLTPLAQGTAPHPL